MIEMTTPVPPGYAGLPALDQSGKVVGVVVDQRFKSTPASGVIPVKELAGKLDAYFGDGKDPNKPPPRNHRARRLVQTERPKARLRKGMPVARWRFNWPKRPGPPRKTLWIALARPSGREF